MSHRDGRVTLSAWVDPVVRDHARFAAKSAGVEFSKWIERAVQRAVAAELERLAQAKDAAMDVVVANSIPRVVLVRALRERAAKARAGLPPQFKYNSRYANLRWAAIEAESLADEIERGEWPGEGER